VLQGRYGACVWSMDSQKKYASAIEGSSVLVGS
jgi:hypothetical protein